MHMDVHDIYGQPDCNGCARIPVDGMLPKCITRFQVAPAAGRSVWRVRPDLEKICDTRLL
jgi:hypothetical protein